MKRELLNEYIGDIVSITFYDGRVKEGKLEYITGFSAAQRWRKVGYFAVDDQLFKCSHVKKLRLLRQEAHDETD